MATCKFHRPFRFFLTISAIRLLSPATSVIGRFLHRQSRVHYWLYLCHTSCHTDTPQAYSCTAGVYCCTRKFRAIKCEHLCDMRFRWRFPSPRDSSLNSGGLPEQVSLLRSTGHPHHFGSWKLPHTSKYWRTLFIELIAGMIQIFKSQIWSFHQAEASDLFELVSPADKGYYIGWLRICHSTSSLK